MRHPEPFKRRTRGPEADREMLAWMFERCGAIVVVTPRGGVPSAGTQIELGVLEREPHPAVASASWVEENERLVRDVGSFFDYRMKRAPHDVSVAGESLARCAWLACMMARLFECGPMGCDLTRQIARSDALLNQIARRAQRPIEIPLEADPDRPALLPKKATAETCRPVLEFWLAGPGYTADWLTSGKPAQDIIEASKVMRDMLRDWCARAHRRFPELAAPAAAISLPLGAAMLRIEQPREAIDELTKGLGAADARDCRASMLTNRALAWSELGAQGKAIADFTAVLDDEGLLAQTRPAVLQSRAILLNELGHPERPNEIRRNPVHRIARPARRSLGAGVPGPCEVSN